MTPTREQLDRALWRAAHAAKEADRHLRQATLPGMHTADRAYHTAKAWEAYFALGEALRQTGTEPPQPAEGP